MILRFQQQHADGRLDRRVASAEKAESASARQQIRRPSRRPPTQYTRHVPGCAKIFDDAKRQMLRDAGRMRDFIPTRLRAAVAAPMMISPI